MPENDPKPVELSDETLEEWWKNDNWIPEAGRWRDSDLPRTPLQVVIDAYRAARQELAAANRRMNVQIPLWKGIASALVARAKRIKCQFGGDHSIADCRCDPHQLGDAVFTMQDELDRGNTEQARLYRERIAELEQQLADKAKCDCNEIASLTKQSQRDRERIEKLEKELQKWAGSSTAFSTAALAKEEKDATEMWVMR